MVTKSNKIGDLTLEKLGEQLRKTELKVAIHLSQIQPIVLGSLEYSRRPNSSTNLPVYSS